MRPITSFSGEHRFLSNFWPCQIVISGMPTTFPTVEHAFVWSKTFIEGERQRVLNKFVWHARCLNYVWVPREKPLTPGQVKRLGRGFTLRPDWEDVKTDVMTMLVRAKFTGIGSKELRGLLLSTGERPLIEGNHWGDQIWGAVLSPETGVWEGENRLGRILEMVRAELRG